LLGQRFAVQIDAHRFPPITDGRPPSKFAVVCRRLAGPVKETGQARHRPSGLAIGPDGALYISDDQHGRILADGDPGLNFPDKHPARI
jgi:glucose/arabinose dehydrogenase